jgi:hypothetical protein
MLDALGRGCIDGKFTNRPEISIKSIGGGTIFSGFCCSEFGRSTCVVVSQTQPNKRGELAVLSLSAHTLLGTINAQLSSTLKGLLRTVEQSD